MMRILVIVLALLASGIAQETRVRSCDCTTGKTVCISEAQMAGSATHIEMEPDLMGNHSNASGVVVFQLIVGKNGKVKNAQAISGHPIAISLLIGAVPKWRFQPFVEDGTKKQTCGPISLRFRILNNRTSVEVMKPSH
jgi:hypothetical protein